MPTALIVEDEPEANRLLSLLVQLRSYQTLSALDGAQAAGFLETARPDVVFLDLMLPDTNGYDICRRIKASPETALIPVVIVSARLAEENRARCFQIGAVAYVPKPYLPDQLYQALGRAEAWSRDLAASPDRGTFEMGRDDEARDRALARLRSILVARTPLGLERIGMIVRSLRSIGQSAANWSRRQEVCAAAQVSYEVGTEALTIRIDDCSSWFSGGDLTEAAAGFDPSLDLVFDIVDRGEGGAQVVLVVNLDRVEAS
jgi:CheY-like chemotaxis protein